MWLDLCLIALVIVGILLMLSEYDHKTKTYNEGHKLIFGGVITIFFSIAGLISSGFILYNVVFAGQRFDEDMIRYQVLEYEEKNNYMTFASDVVDYNQDVYRYKKWGTNPWIGSYFYYGCENLPYYEFDGFDVGEFIYD